MEQNRYYDPAHRSVEVLVGLIALLAGAAGVYFGCRGLLAYSSGVRAAPADPTASAVGLIAGLGASWIASRLLRGAPAGNRLLPQGFLLVTSLVALAGGVWTVWLGLSLRRIGALQLQTVIVFAGIGVMGLTLWWRRRRSSPNDAA